MTNYTLSDITNTPVGTFKVRLSSEFAGLTVPTFNTILEIGDFQEANNITVEESEIGNLTIKLKDDYTVYTEGFWYKVLQGDSQIRIYLTENTDKLFFYGTPQLDSVEWEELYLGATFVRVCTLTLVTVVANIWDTTIPSWVADVYANRQATGYAAPINAFSVINIKGLFAALLSSSGLNPSYSLADVTIYYNSQDFLYRKGGVTFTPNEVWLPITYDSGAGETKTEYYDSTQANYLGNKYSQIRDLLQDTLRNFGLVMRMDYDTAGDRHLIQLIQKGRAYSTVLTFGSREKISRINRLTNLSGDAARATFLINSAKFVWFSKKFTDSAPSVVTVPNYVKFDVDYTIPFIVDENADSAPSGPGANTSYAIYLGATVGTVGLADEIQYWKYRTGAYETPSTGTVGIQQRMCQVVSGYPFNRFTLDMTAVERTYSKITANDGSTESFVHPNIMKRTNLDLDGAGSVVFFANKVTKKPMSNEIEIQWLKETA